MTKNISATEKRNVTLANKRTTLQLEGYIWDNASAIATATNRSLSELLNDIAVHKHKMAMAPSVRLFLMLYLTHYKQNLDDRLANDQLAVQEDVPQAQQSYDYALLRFQAMAKL